MFMNTATNEKFETAWEAVEEATERLDFSEMYDEMLDEVGDVEIGSLVYSASLVLERVDPIAYRCGYSDYLDGMKRDFEYELKRFGSVYIDDEEIIELEEIEGLSYRTITV